MIYSTIIQALTTLALGAIAAIIAYRQWRTSHDRLVLDLFERRFQAFQELIRVIAEAFNKPAVEIKDLANFDAASEKARYLFGTEVQSYLSEIRTALITINTNGYMLTRLPDGEQRAKIEAEIRAALDKTKNEFYVKLSDMLTPYLRLGTRS
jgi:hypothetical protein